MRAPNYYATDLTSSGITDSAFTSYTTSSVGQDVYIDGSTLAQLQNLQQAINDHVRNESLRQLDENLDRILQSELDSKRLVIRGFDALDGWRGTTEGGGFSPSFDFYVNNDLQEKVKSLFYTKNKKEREKVLRIIQSLRLNIIDFFSVAHQILPSGWSKNIIKDEENADIYFMFKTGDKLFFGNRFGMYNVSGFRMGKGTVQSSTVVGIINDLLKS